ncbi:cell wall hydrolase, partial [Methyloceanibacter sp.]|uniref:cell wall hydrolase n=1 Tax=Methyloceanibacter sp. TaxID=1965321 RepID=UPI003C78F275
MRYRRLLFIAVLSLLGCATPVYAALGIEPRRLPPAMEGAMDMVDAKLPIPELDQAASNYDPEQRDYLIRTIAFEAADEADEGKAAVAHVILNRKRSGRWGDNIKDVVTRPWQFEPWMTRRTEMERLSPDDPRYEDAARIADAVLSGQTPDPTAGATHFLNPTVVRQRRGGSLPSWAQGEGQPIGRHTFYYPNEDTTERAALSMGDLADPHVYDTSSQPLTRADCGKAGMLWNEGANVCTDSTSTLEANPNLFQPKAPEVRGDALADLGGLESKSTKGGEAPAAVHKPEKAAMERPGEVKTAAPPKPKTAKSSTHSRAKVSVAKTSSRSKFVKSGGSRGRVVVAKLSTKSSKKTASRSSAKNTAKTASNSSLKSASKSSMKAAVNSHSIRPRVASAYKRNARARSAATTA